MSRIKAAFAALKRKKSKALIPYLTVGYPNLKMLPDLVEACAAAGADLVELGVPFSDPLADGSTIQAASEQALRNRVTPSTVLRQVEILRRRKVTLPIALMTYYNPVLHYGLQAFCRDALSSGADGLIIPDLPPEESKELIAAARPLGIDTIFLASPTSLRARLAELVKASTGFLYYVSLTGVTGARAALPPDLAAPVRSIKRMTPLPVCVGFGISNPEQVRQVAKIADGVIIGSALLNQIGRAGRRAPREVERFLRRLKQACG